MAGASRPKLNLSKLLSQCSEFVRHGDALPSDRDVRALQDLAAISVGDHRVTRCRPRRLANVLTFSVRGYAQQSAREVIPRHRVRDHFIDSSKRPASSRSAS